MTDVQTAAVQVQPEIVVMTIPVPLTVVVNSVTGVSMSTILPPAKMAYFVQLVMSVQAADVAQPEPALMMVMSVLLVVVMKLLTSVPMSTILLPAVMTYGAPKVTDVQAADVAQPEPALVMVMSVLLAVAMKPLTSVFMLTILLPAVMTDGVP